MPLRRYSDGRCRTEVVGAPAPTAGRGEVRVGVPASGVEYTDTLIRQHGIAEHGYRRSFAALKRGGLLCAYG